MQILVLIRFAVIALSIGCVFAATTSYAENHYSAGGWPTLHFDAGNRRAVDVAVLKNHYERWSVLPGVSVLTAPVTSPDGQSLYFTTGVEHGNANLHAYTIRGELLWQSAPWIDANTGVDPCAILSSPIVDTAGDIYIGDCNQLFAFKPDGTQKWLIDLPYPQEGDWFPAGDHPVNAFTTAVFTAEGHLLGVTNFGDVVIVDRDSGKVLNEPYRLPAVSSPYAVAQPLPDSLLADGLIDPLFKEWAWQVIFAGNMRSGNTPAVGRNGRVFLVGSSSKLGIGALFGFDIVATDATGRPPYTINAAFITEIGIGSGSSPALSPQEDAVYVSDEEGWFYAVSAQRGGIEWKIKTAAAAGAAAVGPDGTVYALQVHPAHALVAITPQGEVKWQSDVSLLLEDRPSSLFFGSPIAVANGNPVVTQDAVLVPLMFGYTIPFTKLNIPTQSVVAALDLQTGKAIRSVTSLMDDSSGITAVLPDGTLVNSLGTLMTSALSPLRSVVNLLLPGEQAMMEPVGGVQVSRPVKD